MCCEELMHLLNAPDRPDCFSQSNVAKEHGKEFRVTTKQGLCRIKNDGCLNKSNEEQKCDFIFKACATHHILLVELKGGDIHTAMQQIIATYRKISPVLKGGHSFQGHIVSSTVPRAAELRFRQLKEKCLREHKLNISKQHFKCEIAI